MRYGIAISTYNSKFGPIVFRQGDLAANLALARRLGYHGIDLFIDRRSAAEIDQIRRLVSAAGLETVMYIGIFMAEMGLDLSAADPERQREYLALYKSQIELARRTGARYMPIGNIRREARPGEPQDAHHARLAATLHALSGYAADRGITLCLEPTNHYECKSLNSALAGLDFLLEYELERVGLLLDTFHMNIEDASMEAAIRRARNRILHFHCPDTNRGPAGSGHLDYAAILGALRDAGYSGYLTLEAFPRPDAETCARTHLEALRREVERAGLPA